MTSKLIPRSRSSSCAQRAQQSELAQGRMSSEPTPTVLTHAPEASVYQPGEASTIQVATPVQLDHLL